MSLVILCYPLCHIAMHDLTNREDTIILHTHLRHDDWIRSYAYAFILCLPLCGLLRVIPALAVLSGSTTLVRTLLPDLPPVFLFHS